MRARTYLLLAFLPLAGGCQEPLQDFSSTDLKFKARYPAMPKRTEQPGPFGVKLAQYASQTDDGTCTIAVADLPITDGESDDVKQDRLDGAVDAMVRGARGKLASRKPITLNSKYPGREVVAGTPEGNLVARLYIVNRRLYQVVVRGSGDFAGSAQARAFLDSFQLIE